MQILLVPLKDNIMRTILTLTPMYEISMLVGSVFAYLIILLYVIPTSIPIVPPELFGDGKIIHVTESTTTIRGRWGMLMLVPHSMGEYYLGSTWTIKTIGGQNAIGELIKE